MQLAVLLQLHWLTVAFLTLKYFVLNFIQFGMKLSRLEYKSFSHALLWLLLWLLCALVPSQLPTWFSYCENFLILYNEF